MQAIRNILQRISAIFTRVEYVPVEKIVTVEKIVEVEKRVEVPVQVDPIEKVKVLVDYMKSQGVYKFNADGVEVEFGLNVTRPPTSIDDKQEQLNSLRQALAEVADDDKINMSWSV